MKMSRLSLLLVVMFITTHFPHNSTQMSVKTTYRLNQKVQDPPVPKPQERTQVNLHHMKHQLVLSWTLLWLYHLTAVWWKHQLLWYLKVMRRRVSLFMKKDPRLHRNSGLQQVCLHLYLFAVIIEEHPTCQIILNKACKCQHTDLY